ncbi:hypothetical protein OD91_0322 [Lutibacter sp. Hel_I_33_5]|uniref:hypothetical protein n=1 Tax=Lutibacter sp. Hel_I_33_5 TaxID=1566289 RepID=UPI0011A1C923|nr:hypothetical protein [Lutibacter sp. Hel_I_33_5]TVZ55080.1 hypothetical protein OD91_0322 [Lutibacter sp. Hel_I_33_5]
MIEEDRNTRKRKIAQLTFKEKIPFFLFPFGFGSNLFPVKDYNDSELDRFKKYGFEKKYNDAIKLKKLGIIFYFIIPIILLLFKTLNS